MRVVRFTYTSTEVAQSVWIFLYLRMNGIYVYERFFDVDKIQIEHMRKMLLEKTDIDKPSEYVEYDMDLYLISKQEELASSIEYESVPNAIYIVKEELLSEAKKAISQGTIISYGSTEREIYFLYNLLEKMEAIGLIDSTERENLDKSARIYDKYSLMNFLLKSKYFYCEVDSLQRENTCRRYKDIVKEIFDELRKSESFWGDKDTIYLQYAALNMAYEGNLYCKKNKRAMLYTPESIAKNCIKMLNRDEVDSGFEKNIHLLLAQIYDDLLENKNAAYEEYLPACEDYSAYAFFKKACYWKDYASDYKKAIRYFAKSAWIYPCYYRAWYMLGTCYCLEEKWDSALDAFENVESILLPRLEQKSIRPMEIDHLFRTENQCAFIWNKKKDNIAKALDANLKAEKVWLAIGNTAFIKMMCGENVEQERVKERLRNELKIKKIYKELGKLYQRADNTEMTKIYLEKMGE